MDYRWTGKGLIVEITNTVYGMLEQGGIAGRVEHYDEAEIKRVLQYTRDDDMDVCADGELSTRLDMVRHHLKPRILHKGVRIQ